MSILNPDNVSSIRTQLLHDASGHWALYFRYFYTAKVDQHGYLFFSLEQATRFPSYDSVMVSGKLREQYGASFNRVGHLFVCKLGSLS